MKLLTVLLCEDTCARCSPFQKAGGQCRHSPCSGIPDWQFKRIDHNGSQARISCSPSNCTYHTHMLKNESVLGYFMRILTQFLCSLGSFKLSTLGVRHPSRMPSLLDCYSTRHSRSLVFLQL